MQGPEAAAAEVEVRKSGRLLVQVLTFATGYQGGGGGGYGGGGSS